MVLGVALAVGLGLWQLDAWQVRRDAARHDLADAPAKPLTSVMGGDSPFPGESLGQPVTFHGRWLDHGTVYISGRVRDGRTGYWVVSPLLVDGTRSAMPVVRGWSAKPEAAEPSGQVAVNGYLQASEGTGATDSDPEDDVIPEMRIASVVEHVDADLYSAYVVAKDAGTGSDGLEKVTPSSVPEISNTSHLRNLLYAFQWWIFGGFAVYIWVRWCRDQLEAAAGPAQPVAG
jgi:cytochrome oxidase assembly protein ShyY1